MNTRVDAARAVLQVVDEGRSLSQVLAQATAGYPSREAGLLQELCYGTLRWWPRLEALAAQLLERPMKGRDRDVYTLLLVGLYQLAYLRVPSHAAVSETVAATQALGKPWAKGLLNAVLRNYLRRAPAVLALIDQDEVARFAHPAWWLETLKQAWPGQWQAIVNANNERPPLVLRVNRRQISRDDYLAQLTAAGIAARPLAHAPEAVLLEQAMAVNALPGFAAGQVSVQDGAAQLAAHLLALAPGQRVLDACAAPGGKTCHLLELEPGLARVIALDSDGERLHRVAENLQRLGLEAELVTGDAADPTAWWDGRPFDRILLDAPCSASGVIRRHPDIKLLRRPQDIPALVAAQHRILEALWPLLTPGGRLLYATCSVLPEENAVQITTFLQHHTDAVEIQIKTGWGVICNVGRQIFPGNDAMDGFYYACLEKTAVQACEAGADSQ